jgi:hypothetical protein
MSFIGKLENPHDDIMAAARDAYRRGARFEVSNKGFEVRWFSEAAPARAAAEILGKEFTARKLDKDGYLD